MADSPNIHILDKSKTEEIREKLRAPLGVLEDVANYGSHLILRVWENTPKGMGDVVLVNHLLRLIVTHLDGLHTLLSTASGPTALLQLRSMLEASLLLEWVAKDDSETKGTYLAVSGWRKRKNSAHAFIPGTPENAAFLSAVPSFTISPEKEARAREELSNIDKVLAQTDLAPINANFDQLAQKMTFEPEWIVAYDYAAKKAAGSTKPKKLSIRGLAKELGREHEYRYFYSKLSNETHGSALSGSVAFPGDHVVTHNVRRLNEFNFTFSTAVTLALRSYRLILNRYRPGETSLEKRYLSEWQSIFKTQWIIKEVPARMPI